MSFEKAKELFAECAHPGEQPANPSPNDPRRSNLYAGLAALASGLADMQNDINEIKSSLKTIQDKAS
ncbi:MAG: hypothetical protein ABIF82_05380 [Planctomycetota bacterium]